MRADDGHDRREPLERVGDALQRAALASTHVSQAASHQPTTFRAQRLLLELRLARDAARSKLAQLGAPGAERHGDLVLECSRLRAELEDLSRRLEEELATPRAVSLGLVRRREHRVQ